MSKPIDAKMVATIQHYDPEQRLAYLLKEVVTNNEIWILTDQDGCVMLNTDDEDCAPVWPNQEFAQAWATGEWAECKAEAISLNKWHSRWTSGLEQDDVAIAVFPNLNEEGLVISSQELDFELKQQAGKNN
ncbi:MAG: hypothetical protein ACI88A_000984 [Paraglaciecola sp.]|jgi:hypothetical protein